MFKLNRRLLLSLIPTLVVPKFLTETTETPAYISDIKFSEGSSWPIGIVVITVTKFDEENENYRHSQWHHMYFTTHREKTEKNLDLMMKDSRLTKVLDGKAVETLKSTDTGVPRYDCKNSGMELKLAFVRWAYKKDETKVVV